MNYKSRILAGVVLAAMAEEQQQAAADVPAVQTDQPQPAQTTEVAPSAQVPVNPHAEDPNTPSNRGKLRANSILAAEMGLVAAEVGLQQTRLDGLIEIALIEREEDRVAWFSGLDIALTAQGVNGKKQKKHQGYTAEIRRVWDVTRKYRADLEHGEAYVKSLIEMLQGKGTYQEKVQKLPVLSNAGGANRGQGTSNVRQVASQAIQAHGQGAADAIAKAAAIVQEQGPEALQKLLQTGPATAPVESGNKPGPNATLMRDGKPVGGITPDKAELVETTGEAPEPITRAVPQTPADKAIVEAIMSAKDEALEALTICLANRLERSQMTELRDIGYTMLEMLGLKTSEDDAGNEHPAAAAA